MFTCVARACACTQALDDGQTAAAMCPCVPNTISHRRLDMMLADKTRTSRSVGMQAEKSASEARIVKALGIHQVHICMYRSAYTLGLGCYTQATWRPTMLPVLDLYVDVSLFEQNVTMHGHFCRSTWYCLVRLGSKGGAKWMVHLRKGRMTTILMFRHSALRTRSVMSRFICA
jgi:hypothetical protein